MNTPVNPSFTVLKWEVRGYTCLHDVVLDRFVKSKTDFLETQLKLNYLKFVQHHFSHKYPEEP